MHGTIEEGLTEQEKLPTGNRGWEFLFPIHFAKQKLQCVGHNEIFPFSPF